jgi:tricorn protease
MRTTRWVISLLFLAAGVFAGAQTHLMRLADVHGDQIVFTYEGDLWLASAQGGDARRITSDPGSEAFAKFSPDGKWIAFTAGYDGGMDVYLMPAGGGVPKRLTYHPAPDLVLGWTPDGQSVLFRSRREYPFRGEQVYTISLKGGTEHKLPIDRAGLASLSPDGTQIAYCRLSGENATWKRHQGGDAQELWMGTLSKGDFHVIAPWRGSDNYPMWRGDFIYFTSDREAGTMNVFKFNPRTGEVKAVTRYTDYDVKYPSAGPDSIVYQYGEELYLLDLKTEQSRKLDIRMPSDRVKVRADFISATANPGAFGLNPKGDSLLLETRGEVVVVPKEKDGGPWLNLTRSSGSREKEPAWSPDGKYVAYISDKTGEEEVWLADPKGLKPPKQLTSGNKGYRFHIVWSPDSKYLLFGDKFMRLNLVDASTGAITVVDKGDFDDGWERYGIQDFVWSPDSRWIAYTKKMENANEVVLLYSLDTKQISPVTNDMYQSWSPSFDPKGRYLYLLSNRTFAPTMGQIDQEHIFIDMTLPYVVVLKTGAPSPFAPGSDDEEEQSPAKKEGGDKGKTEAPKASGTVIDLTDLEKRMIPAEGVDPGTYFRLEATDKGFLFVSRPKPVFQGPYDFITDATSEQVDLYAYKLDDKKASEMLEGIQNYHLSADGKKLVYKAGTKYGIVDAGGKAKVGDGVVDLADVKFKIDRLEEFNQEFNEAWRIERDWFYDKNMHGLDWAATGEKYRVFVPDCGNRQDLTYLIGEMIGELNTGHTYTYGGDTGAGGKRIQTGVLGCDFDLPQGSNYYRISHVIPGKAWSKDMRSPLAEPGCPIKEGDYLIAVDGVEVTAADNVFAPFENRAGKLVTLTYNSKPSADGAKTYKTTTITNESEIRYREWVDQRAAIVEKLSGGQIGYLHMPDMSEDGLIEFARGFYPQADKHAIILDDRYNGGGFTAEMIIERLERKTWGVTQPREGKPTLNPEGAARAHFVVLINEDTGSDGEFFARAIQLKKIAPVYGVRTWGGAFGIEAHQNLVDGATVTPPQFGLYGFGGQWLFEGRGVDPDVEIQNMPGDVVKGKDAQLEAAVGYLMDQLKKDPLSIPAPPPYPNKARPHGSDILKP